MSARIRGWCPSAHRPMESGDGLILRIRPLYGRLTEADLRVLATLSERFGQGGVDLTARGSVQIRGVTTPAPLLAALIDAGLVEETPEEEARRAILCAPGAGAADLAAALAPQLADLSDLPSKFGFLVDPGPARRSLATISGDIRIEAGEGGLIVRADGAETGKRVDGAPEAAEIAIALAVWFLNARRAGETRMRRLLETGARPPMDLSGDARPAPEAAPLRPGPAREGLALGAPFGRFSAEALRRIAAAADAVHVSPYRLFLAPKETVIAPGEDLILDPNAPILRIDSCAGAPACAQGEAETRRLARALAERLPEGARAHVSGCAKGCAHPGAADLTLVGRAGRYDAVRNGGAGDAPWRRGLDAEAALALAETL